MSGLTYPETPGFKDRGAGREASSAFTPKVGKRRQEALDGLSEVPITADELAARIRRPTVHVRPRLTELAALGLAMKCEGRGLSEYGAPASLWRRATVAERDQVTARQAAEAEHGSRPAK